MATTRMAAIGRYTDDSFPAGHRALLGGHQPGRRPVQDPSPGHSTRSAAWSAPLGFIREAATQPVGFAARYRGEALPVPSPAALTASLS